MKNKEKRPARRIKINESEALSEAKRTPEFKKRMSEIRMKRIINMESGETYDSLRDLCFKENLEYTRMSNSLADNKFLNNTPYRYYSPLPYSNDSTFINSEGHKFTFKMFFKLTNQSDGYSKHSIAETESGHRQVLNYEATLKYINSND